MNKRLIKRILKDLNNVASYNNCRLNRLIRINDDLFGCKDCAFKKSICYYDAKLKDVKKVVR